MTLPPIPQRKGLIAWSASFDAEEQRWRDIKYRTPEEARGSKPIDQAPDDRKSKPIKRGAIEIDQADLFDG